MTESVDGVHALASALADELAAFDDFGTPTTVGVTEVDGPSGRVSVDTFTNEFWTSKQRAANRLHEVSYRACFKPHTVRGPSCDRRSTTASCPWKRSSAPS